MSADDECAAHNLQSTVGKRISREKSVVRPMQKKFAVALRVRALHRAHSLPVTMTLIACFHPGKSVALMADVLLSSPNAGTDFSLPSRTYVSPEQARKLAARPIALVRKVIEINSRFVMLWSGDYNSARQLAARARDWFGSSGVDTDSIRRFREKYYSDPVSLSVFFAWYDGFAHGGKCLKGNSPHFGAYIAAGSGSPLFVAIINDGHPVDAGGRIKSDDDDMADMASVNITAEFLFREIAFGQTVQSQFGGAFELLLPGPDGFRRIDDVMHIFVERDVGPPHKVNVYPHEGRR